MKLDDDEIQVWRLDRAAEERERGLKAILSPDEVRRAEAFRFDEDRRRFQNCRSALRRILGFHLNEDPARIRFVETEKGKPALPDASLRFNVSHSGEWALIAVSRWRAVGIDIERINPGLDYQSLLKRVCSDHEKERLSGLPAERARREFYVCWTRKEALLKAMGVGLSAAPSRFDVSESVWDGKWELRSLAASDGYAAAVAGEGVDWPLRTLEISRLEEVRR